MVAESHQHERQTTPPTASTVSDRLGALVDQTYALWQSLVALRTEPLDADQLVHLERAELSLLELLTHAKRAQLRIAADPKHWRPAE